MTTNVTVFPVDGPAVIYFQDGSSIAVDAQETKQFQLVEAGFCTISDAPPDSDDTAEKFLEMMVAFWTKLWNEVREEINEPEVNPL